MSDLPLFIQIVGESGSGKTLVVERAVKRLVARGRSVAVVKHSHHSPDLRGKDTGRFRGAGASIVLFASPAPFLSIRARPESLIPILPVDVVLIEGYSRRRFGGLRFRIASPGEAESVLRTIVRAASNARPRPRLEVDGRSRRASGSWRLVHHLMASEGVREVRRLR